MVTYTGLNFNSEELATAMHDGYARLIDFVTTPEFKALDKEMRDLPLNKRPAFVRDVVMKPRELEARGIFVPEDFMIQTSAFGDRRPTLFAVKVWLPKCFHEVWENVNITIDNEFEDEAISRDPALAWRAPLSVDIQNKFLSEGRDLSSALSV